MSLKFEFTYRNQETNFVYHAYKNKFPEEVFNEADNECDEVDIDINVYIENLVYVLLQFYLSVDHGRVYDVVKTYCSANIKKDVDNIVMMISDYVRIVKKKEFRLPTIEEVMEVFYTACTLSEDPITFDLNPDEGVPIYELYSND